MWKMQNNEKTVLYLHKMCVSVEFYSCSNHNPCPPGPLAPCAPYLLVLEGLHQVGRLAGGHGEGEVGSAVAVGHLDAPVAEVALPLGVADHLVLPEKVRDETP